MNHATTTEQIRVPVWAWIFLLTAVLAVYLVSLDNGFVLQGLANQAHEFFHDGRHFLGAPCH